MFLGCSKLDLHMICEGETVLKEGVIGGVEDSLGRCAMLRLSVGFFSLSFSFSFAFTSFTV